MEELHANPVGHTGLEFLLGRYLREIVRSSKALRIEKSKNLKLKHFELFPSLHKRLTK